MKPSLFSACAIFISIALILALLSGCTHAPLNQPLAEHDDDTTIALRYVTADKQSDVAILLFFSGGGKRASAFSYGVLKELARTRAQIGGQPQRLIDHVELISSVSGGSFTAAYYSLYNERIFDDYEKRYLKRDSDFALAIRLLEPALFSSYYARSDMAAAYYDKTLFDGATFGTLAQKGIHHLLLINATDMAECEEFTFSQARFDMIGSNLAPYSIARAVAASSAVPGLLTPITLRNYADHLTNTADGRFALPARPGTPLFQNAIYETEVLKLAETYANVQERPYIHLVDGGLSDNLGLRSVIDGCVAYGGLRQLMLASHMTLPSKLAVIVVNAANKHGGRLSKQGKTPGVVKTMKQILNSTGINNNARHLDEMRIVLDDWRKKTRAASAHTQPLPDYYMIEVDFEKLTDPDERGYFQTIPTSFTLPDKTIDNLVEAGGRILRQSPEFQRLLHELAN